MKCTSTFTATLLTAWMLISSAAGEVPFERVAIDDGVKDPWAKIVADVDGDGFADIVIGGRRGPLVWYRYPDWQRNLITEGGYRTVDGEAGDIDGDGDLDVVMGGLLWYENPRPGGDPAKGPWKAHRVADHKTHDVELADLDGDGDLDIITRDQSDFGARAGDKIYLWRQDEGDKWAHAIIECPHGEGLTVGDIDRDGDPDVVIGGIWFENTGTTGDGFWQGHEFADWHPSASVELADINGDGRPDVVLAPSELKGNWHRLSWFEAPADAKAGDWTEHRIVDRIECVVHGLALADFDGDAAVDIAISEMHQGQDPDEVAVFLNREQGDRWDKQVLSKKGSHSIQAADVGADGDMDLMGANWSGPYQPVELWENRSARRTWWDEDCEYRVRIRVGAGGFERRNVPVEVPVDFTKLPGNLGGDASNGKPRLRLVETSPSGEAIRDIAPVQFDQETSATGTLIFVVPGDMAAQAERFFDLYLDGETSALKDQPSESPVAVRTVADHEGQESFRIETPAATYYYHKQGAGFASMEDADGKDWLSYNPGEGPVSGSGSGGKYRGIPNMGHPEGYCHPGSEKSISRLLTSGPVKATILSESDDGKWITRWDIFPQYARMTVLKTSHPYWFLYEGTPGGELEEESDYCVRCDGTRTDASVRWDGDLACDGAAEWLYFGDGKIDRVLYLVHHTDDEAIDSYWPMNHEMTVFGFGRKGLKKYMERVPDRFTIGFCEDSDFEYVRKVVHSACRPLVVRVGNPEARVR
mgnify:CR=1 FL=1